MFFIYTENSDSKDLPYDSIAKLTEFKRAIANAIDEAGGIKPDISAETNIFTDNIKGILKEVTKNVPKGTKLHLENVPKGTFLYHNCNIIM